MPSPRLCTGRLFTSNKLGVFPQICFYEAPMPLGVWYEGLSLIFFQSDGLTYFIKNCRAPFTDVEYFIHIVIIIGCC